MNAKDAWLATLGQLQIQLNRSTYDTWLRHAELLGYEDGRFVVTVPHAYAKDWIERHLLDAMTRTLGDIFRRECEIQVIVWNPVDEQDEAAPLLAPPDEAPVPANSVVDDRLSALNPAYCLENFVVGQANQYAALLAQSIVEAPIGAYSTVLFCGGMGMGKTHLLQALARSLIVRGDNAIYIAAENFTTELVAAIRSQDNHAFREKFRSADAVIFDDLQFAEGKTSTQNEIVAIWDALRNRQRTMIFASDRLPADMVKISKDAHSRFQAGPIATLDTPDLQLRRDILDEHSARRNVRLPAEVREMIASRAESSPRDLEAALDQLHTFSRLTRQPITATIASTVLHMRGMPPRSTACTLDAVLEATASYYRLTADDLSSRDRKKNVALARQIAMYLARELTGASLLQIGAALGGRDHTTVMHGCTKIADLLTSDEKVAQDVASIRQSLAGADHTPEPDRKNTAVRARRVLRP